MKMPKQNIKWCPSVKSTPTSPAEYPPLVSQLGRASTNQVMNTLQDQSCGILTNHSPEAGLVWSGRSAILMRHRTLMQHCTLRHITHFGFTRRALCEFSVSVKITFSRVKEPSEQQLITAVNTQPSTRLVPKSCNRFYASTVTTTVFRQFIEKMRKQHLTINQ